MKLIFLALVRLLLAALFLTWTMLMGLRERAKADAWAQDRVERAHAGSH